MDFRISKWISGFQSGFLDFRLDFWISDWISADSVRDFFRGGPLGKNLIVRGRTRDQNRKKSEVSGQLTTRI